MNYMFYSLEFLDKLKKMYLKYGVKGKIMSELKFVYIDRYK